MALYNNFDISHTYEDKILNFRDHANEQLSKIIEENSEYNTSLLNEVKFVGISEKGIENLKNAIVTYRNSVKDIIDKYNENAAVQKGFKGPVSDPTKSFISAVKTLLIQYVNSLDYISKLADEALANWNKNMQTMSGTIQDQANNIRSSADYINLQ